MVVAAHEDCQVVPRLERRQVGALNVDSFITDEPAWKCYLSTNGIFDIPPARPRFASERHQSRRGRDRSCMADQTGQSFLRAMFTWHLAFWPTTSGQCSSMVVRFDSASTTFAFGQDPNLSCRLLRSRDDTRSNRRRRLPGSAACFCIQGRCRVPLTLALIPFLLAIGEIHK